MAAGFFAYYLTSGPVNFPSDSVTILIAIVSIIMFATIFAHSRNKIDQEKLQAIKSVAASMAHELRAPLRKISSNSNGIKKYLPILFDAYRKARHANLDVPVIPNENYQALQDTLKNIDSETQGAFAVINMLLVTVGMAKTLIEHEPEKNCSMAKCVETALERYPYDIDERKLVHWPTKESQILDFNFSGKELLVVHVLFNLLKNAFYYLKKAGKGEVFIWLTSDKKNNTLHFKDTGHGITKKVLAHIFDQFYSQTLHGTGIGLTYCKMAMQSMNGDIRCFSYYGEFTEFVLNFPKK